MPTLSFLKVFPIFCYSLLLTAIFRRVKSTPDPDTFEEYRDAPPISIAILLQKYALLLAESKYIQHQFVSRYGSHLYRDTFAEVLGSGVVGTLPILSAINCEKVQLIANPPTKHARIHFIKGLHREAPKA